jgi:hypothetical protein
MKMHENASYKALIGSGSIIIGTVNINLKCSRLRTRSLFTNEILHKCGGEG